MNPVRPPSSPSYDPSSWLSLTTGTVPRPPGAGKLICGVWIALANSGYFIAARKITATS